MAVLSSPPSLSSHKTDRYLDDIWEDETLLPHRPRPWFLIFIFALIIAFWMGNYSAQHSIKPPIAGPFPGEATSNPGKVVVHVCGAVNKPGVYEFPFDARILDAIRKAGGPKQNADINAINLAAWLEDGSRLEVPVKQSAAVTPSQTATDLPTERTPALPEYSLSAPAMEEFIAPPTASTPPPRERATPKPTEKTRTPKMLPGVPRETTPTGGESQNASPEYLAKNPVNLNTATQEQLELLPGVGPSTAEKIIAYRKEKGGFKTADELDEVQGIGEKTMEKLRPLVTVR